MLAGICEGIAPTYSSRNRIYRSVLNGSVALNNSTVFFNVAGCVPKNPGVFLTIGQLAFQDIVSGTNTTFQGQITDGFYGPNINPTTAMIQTPFAFIVCMTIVGISLGTKPSATFPYGAIILQANDATGAGGFCQSNNNGANNNTQLTCVRVGQSQTSSNNAGVGNYS